MAGSLLGPLAGDEYDVFSAGTDPKGIHPRTIEAMKEVDIDFAGHTAKDLRQFPDDRFDFVITVCDRARQHCPVFPGAEPIHWGFDDPAEAPDGRRLDTFRRVRDQMTERLRLFVLSQPRLMPPPTAGRAARPVALCSDPPSSPVSDFPSTKRSVAAGPGEAPWDGLWTYRISALSPAVPSASPLGTRGCSSGDCIARQSGGSNRSIDRTFGIRNRSWRFCWGNESSNQTGSR